jgi:hypothetical protein
MRDWISKHTLVALTLIGLLFYGGALLSYSNFYGALGVTPEEAGVDYTTTLARALPAFVSWLWEWVSVLITLLVFGLAAWAVDRYLLRGRVGRIVQSKFGTPSKQPEDAASGSEDETGPDTEPADQTRSSVVMERVTNLIARRIEWLVKLPAATLSALAILLIALLFLWNASNTATGLAEQVKRGHTVVPAPLFSDWIAFRFDFLRNPLRLRIGKVQVWPADPGHRLPADVKPGTTWTLLGRSSDIVILRHIGGPREETLRIPAALVVLTRGTIYLTHLR